MHGIIILAFCQKFCSSVVYLLKMFNLTYFNSYNQVYGPTVKQIHELHWYEKIMI